MSSGLLASVQNLLASLLGLARTRLDLLSTELQEALAHFALGIIIAVAAVLLGTLGVAFAAAALVLSVGPEHRLLATGVVGSIVGAYFGVKVGTDQTKTALQTAQQESATKDRNAAKAQVYALHVAPGDAETVEAAAKRAADAV